MLRAGTARHRRGRFDLPGALAEEKAAVELVGLPRTLVPVWRSVLGLLSPDPDDGGGLRVWVDTVEADGWAWAAAGFTPDQARALIAPPVGHPDRPGPEQLAAMAALRA